MTAHSDLTGIEPYWFGRTEQDIRAAVEAREESWASVPGYGWYEWSDKGRARSLPRTIGSRHVGGTCPLKFKPNNSGYLIHNVVPDAGKQVTVAVAPMVLLAHHPAFAGLSAFPAGLETRHNPAIGDKTFNAYPEGLWPGTKPENAADKGEQDPLHPCRNAPACANLVVTPGRRCVGCVTAVGREAAELLRLGMPLQQVAERFGYTGPDWVYQLAVRFGGYEGGRAEARTQRPGLAQRLRLAARRGSDALAAAAHVALRLHHQAAMWQQERARSAAALPAPQQPAAVGSAQPAEIEPPRVYLNVTAEELAAIVRHHTEGE
jgi:hypothetical protein